VREALGDGGGRGRRRGARLALGQRVQVPPAVKVELCLILVGHGDVAKFAVERQRWRAAESRSHGRELRVQACSMFQNHLYAAKTHIRGEVAVQHGLGRAENRRMRLKVSRRTHGVERAGRRGEEARALLGK